MKFEKMDRKTEGSAGKQFAHFVKVGYNRARQVNQLVLNLGYVLVGVNLGYVLKPLYFHTELTVTIH